LSASGAAATALASALVLGISAVADQRSTKRVRMRKGLSPAIILDLARQWLWLIAILANLVGFALQVVALSLGSLAVVQPLLVFDLVFAVLISWLLDRRAKVPVSGRRRSTPLMFSGVAAVTGGVAGFLAVGQPSAGTANVGFSVLVPLVIGFAVVVGGCLAVAKRSPKLRPLAMALACGVSYGVSAFAVKLVTSEFGGGAAKVFTNWPIYVLAVAGPLGYLFNQYAFQQGRSLAPVQSIITSADPIISIALSVLWLNVVLRDSPAAIFGEVASLLLMVAGIVVTAHNSPHVTRRAARAAGAGGATAGAQPGLRGSRATLPAGKP
jgi:drug/metabolite transporter (DMT)-like permease